MKKFLSVFLALVMTFSLLATSALAAELPGNSSHDVKINLEGTINNKYSVDVDFPELVFTYTADTKWSIEGDTYSYVADGNATWSAAQTVKVTNHSDLPLNFTASANKATAYSSLNVTITDGADVTIAKCEVGDTFGEHYAEFTVAVTGTPPTSAKTGDTIATLLVAFSAG